MCQKPLVTVAVALGSGRASVRMCSFSPRGYACRPGNHCVEKRAMIWVSMPGQGVFLGKITGF